MVDSNCGDQEKKSIYSEELYIPKSTGRPIPKNYFFFRENKTSFVVLVRLRGVVNLSTSKYNSIGTKRRSNTFNKHNIL